jgi:hypothetical protein
MQSGQSGGTHSLRNNFLNNSDNIGILKLILLVQFLSLVTAFCILFVAKIDKKIIKIIGIIFFSIFILFAGFAVLFAFNFNPQIG